MRILLIILSTTALSFAQNPAFVKETCGLLKRNDQLEVIQTQTLENFGFFVDNDSTRSGLLQQFYRFQYKLRRELIRTCPAYQLGEFKIKTQRVVDIDSIFSVIQIDSLKSKLLNISELQNLYILLVTIDDYYPAASLQDFAEDKLIQWGNGEYFEKGDLIMAINIKKREVRISTSQESMKYITDTECTETNQVMIKEFKNSNYFKGVMLGLEYLTSKI